MSKEIKLFEGDIYIENGKVKTIVNDEKMAQQTLKIILSDKGGSIFHPEYGSGMFALIGRYTDKESLQALSIDEIRNTLIFYQRIQSNQELFQELTDAEVLHRLQSVDVNRISPTVFRIDIKIMNREGNVVNIPAIQRI